MKKLLFLFLLFSTFFGFAQYTAIPDANFEKALIGLGIDRGTVDGRVLTANASKATSLSISNNGITDLTGIEDFVSLTSLLCYNNKITNLNLNSPSLVTLFCGDNQLRSLDISKCLALENLTCANNQLKSLDITKNKALTTLHCNDNQITSLDITNNAYFTSINCYNNQLTTLNLKNGNNNLLVFANTWSNPNLTCLQVDYNSKAYMNGLIRKDPTASYSENCSKTAAVAPPVITATGNQSYCPGTSLKIVETISITNDPAEPDTDAIYIQVSSGYINGQDILTLANPTAHPAITTSWDSTAGKLKLFSPTGNKIPYTDFVSAIKDVEFSNSSTNPTGTRNFSITIGSANFLPSTGHYYEYVPNIGITWTSAKVAAESLNYYGLKGYLATLLTLEEAVISGKQAQGAGWIGGSDAAVEGEWRWVTGPEGLANGGAGVVFWIGNGNGISPAPINFAYWNTPNGEPNQFLGRQENYAHITAQGVGITGSWNDLTNTGDPSGNYQPKGYIVEYGGMPGDPILQISASTKITIPTVTVGSAQTRCGSGVVNLIASSTSGIIDWYDVKTGGTLLFTGNNFAPNVTATTTFYAEARGCESTRKGIVTTIIPLPVVNDVTIIQCDTDLIVDGKTLFNLTVKNNEISSNFNNENFTFYISLNGAINEIPSDLIPNPIAFENSTPTQMDVWSRVTDKLTSCASISKITLKVPATNISPTYKIPFEAVCDDFLDVNGNNNLNNNKRDGITTFDFSSTKGIILGLLPTGQTYTINYYKNEADALAEMNAITNISNYRNIGYPNSQDIWIRIDSDLDNACYGLGPYLTLNVEALPFANAVSIPRQCDDNSDGIFPFNTTTLESDLVKGQTNVSVTYFDGANNPLKDANGAAITSPFPSTFASTSQTIKAVVTNKTPQKCFDETLITFIVDKSPAAFPIAANLTISCDDEQEPINQNGEIGFDTSSFDSTILGGQSGMSVKYFDQNGNSLPSPLPNPFVTKTQTITARVENSLNSNCSASTLINFVVHPLPNINLNIDGNDNELVCSNLSTFFVTLDAGIFDGSPTTNYNYVWTKDAVPIGGNSPTLPVNEKGTYTVEVSNSLGCSRVRTITVNASNVATITSVDVVELSDNNTITINVTGPGEYQYSLDEPNGYWQDAKVFNNVPAGIHIVYVNDKNGCGTIHEEVVILGIPKFFTPNGDNFNDHWEIKGVVKYPQAEVQIFDRYGKYLTTLNTANKNWSGTYNDAPLPADDYWYILNLGNGKPEIKGHFSLKR